MYVFAYLWDDLSVVNGSDSAFGFCSFFLFLSFSFLFDVPFCSAHYYIGITVNTK